MINERLAALRRVMKEEHVQALIIPTSDFHDTEYVCDYFAARAYFSGFTGSAGTLIVLAQDAALWTDGRYFIQAAAELKGSGITLMKMGQPDTPSIEAYILDHLHKGDTVAADGRCISNSDFKKWKAAFATKGIAFETEKDLPGMAWENRPALPATQTFHYPEKYAGRSVAEKLARVREAMRSAGAAWLALTKIDEIAWLFNLRANDIPDFPVALAYALIGEDDGTLFIDSSRLDQESRAVLEENNIAIAGYDDIYQQIREVQGPVMMDPATVNARLAGSVKEPVWKDSPVILMKAMKNETELEGAKEAHLKDGAAVVRFWKWLEETLPEETITEISAAEKLTQLRAQQPDYLEDSFETIAAYGPNAAMCHYHPDASAPVRLEPKGLFLVDSGGQYLQGTTDITRTFVMGDITDEERDAFTRVLMGHIDLAKASFLHGARGINLDILARRWLWDQGQDFNHGTGHGVGHLLSVHEAPNGIRWRIVPERNDSCILEPGMVTSNEPGLYEEGKFGIRHENLMAVREKETNGYGRFLHHETLTKVPFDVRGLNVSLMQPDQIEWLNQYHQDVYNSLADLLNEEEKAWLKEKTRPIAA